MRDNKVLFMIQAALIAAIYVVLTMMVGSFGSGQIQLRISEALTVLPYFTPAAIPGLFIGCLIANTLAGNILIDIVFGSLATLAAALLSYSLRKHKYLVCVPPIVINMIVVPFVLHYGYQIPLPIPFLMLTIGIGQVLSCGVLGNILLKALEMSRKHIFQY
ncbi:MAG TPA: QueT transporter family protein [Candidatus Merdenecus merdavium]|nr:QueT transporter family protein [Candidatus Merdenecus merdavium]